jgi:ankyrin repeat protein
VRHGADLNEVVGATPLYMAVDVLRRGVEGKPRLARQRLALLKEMLRLGADPNIPDGRGTTPLRLALAKAYGVDVFRLLLEHGADPDAPGGDGRTVREIAARKRDRRYAGAVDRV